MSGCGDCAESAQIMAASCDPSAVQRAIWQALCHWLASPTSYPEGTRDVTSVETHISRVFLTDRHAYKLKKPLKYDFIDYSTRELRHAACDAEQRLNRRLANNVYEEVVAIGSDGQDEFHWLGPHDSPDNAIEWLVKMRRLDERDTLEARLCDHRVTAAMIDGLVDRLTHFYRSAEVVNITATEYRAGIERHVRDNWRILRENVSSDRRLKLIDKIHGAQLRMLAICEEMFDARVQTGRIVDGHGDLRPEHIFLEPNPQVIDGIEFSAELRQVDVADELSFLQMECQRIHKGEIGTLIVQSCLSNLAMEAPRQLLAFYRCYRACVRAKVAQLRSQQQDTAEALTSQQLTDCYLELADGELICLPRPLLIVVRGLSGTGKSTLARWLGEKLGAEVLSTDALRKSQIVAPHAEDSDRYSQSRRQAIYDELNALALVRLLQGQSVILDGTFLKGSQRLAAALLAEGGLADFLLVTMKCPPEVAKGRIIARLQAGTSNSEAWPDLVDEQLAAEEPDPDGLACCAIDSLSTISIMGEDVIKALRRLVHLP